VTPVGELAIRETDLSIPGRGMDLKIERMWGLPTCWQNNAPYGFESSPMDLGKGWFMNFPWISNLLHTWDGRSYTIKWSSNVFENHDGEYFRLVKESNGTYTLYYPSGMVLYFDSSGKLTTIKDANDNVITFAYGAWPVTNPCLYPGPAPDPPYPLSGDWYVANITDTVGRVVRFLYSSNHMLMGLSYCGMTVDYSYNQGLLVSVKDVQGRHSYYEYYCAYGAWLPYKVQNPEGQFKTYKWIRIACNYSDNAFYKFKISEESLYDFDSKLVSQTVSTYCGNFSCTDSSIQVLKDEYGNAKTKSVCTLDSKGRVLSSTLLDMTNAQSTLCSESLSATKDEAKFSGGGYWNGTEFVAHYIFGRIWGIDYYGPHELDNFEVEDGDVEVGNFTHYPGQSGYQYYTTSVSPDKSTITVTTFWTNWTIPQIEKTVYAYNSNSEVIKADKYVGDTSTVSYSTYSRYDDWGNLVYSKDAMGYETFFSYANTETSGVFVDNDGRAKPLFSNLFYGNAVPSNIHSALIGSAKLQDNGTAVESYSKYDSKGNLIESRTVFGQKTAFAQFSGTFEEPSATSFSINLAGVNMQGNATLEISGQPKINQIPKTEAYSKTGNGFDGTGYWENHLHNGKKYFMAYYLFGRAPDFEEGYAEVGPFQHYPGTAGYTGYSVSRNGAKTNVTVTTNYNVPTDYYPVMVSYRFNTQLWEAITQNLYSSVKVHPISASELTAGMNTLYFSESSGNLTKFSWKLCVPIYAPPREDIMTQNAYDSYGNVVSSTDAEGLVTLFEYGSEYGHAYCTRTTVDPNGFNITSSGNYYFDRGLVASITNPEGYATYFEYDNLGRMIRTVNPDGTQLVTVYDDENRTVTSYNELGNFGKTYYNCFGKTIKGEVYLTANEVYAVQTLTYENGALAAMTVFHAPEVVNPASYRYEYDIKGRVVKSILPDGTFTRIEYDDINKTVTVFDANGHKTESKTDRDGNILWVREYYNESAYYLTQYEYDALGHLIEMIDANGQVTTYEYNSIFGSTKTVYPDSTLAQRSFNKIGQTLWAADRDSDNTTYTYDALNRLIQTTRSDLTTVDYMYDNCSRLISASQGNYSYSCKHDSRGRVIWESNTVADPTDIYDVLFDYDAAGRLAKMIYPDGLEVSYEYDNLNRITRLYSGNYTFASFDYNVDNMPNSVSYGNGLNTRYTYDSSLQLAQMLTTDPNQDNLTMLSLDYTYDNIGNILQITDERLTPGGLGICSTETYQYDWLNRLVSANIAGESYTYSYDAVGNRLAETKNGVTTTYQYDSCNRLVSCQNGLSNMTFTYDHTGNLIARIVDNETWQYVYDKGDRLVEVAKEQTLGSYSYDTNGRRICQLEGPTKTITVYSGTNPIWEKISESAVQSMHDYIYGPGGRVAALTSNGVMYYHNDHLSSTRLVTDTSANVLTTMSYGPFGERAEVYGIEDKLGFNGKEEDSQTGLYYYCGRYYDPTIGRFIQEDSVTGAFYNPQSLNKYVYCRNNPLRFIDPTGHMDKTGYYNPETYYDPIIQACMDILDCAIVNADYEASGSENNKLEKERIEKLVELRETKAVLEQYASLMGGLNTIQVGPAMDMTQLICQHGRGTDFAFLGVGMFLDMPGNFAFLIGVDIHVLEEHPNLCITGIMEVAATGGLTLLWRNLGPGRIPIFGGFINAGIGDHDYEVIHYAWEGLTDLVESFVTYFETNWNEIFAFTPFYDTNNFYRC